MKKLGFILFSLALLAGLTGATIYLAAPSPLPDTDRETFERANQLYLAGNYAAATSLYEQLAAKGISNPELFYNLGIAYTKSNQPKLAAMAFANAFQLTPRDAQISGRVPRPGLTSRLPVPLSANELALAALLATSSIALLLVSARRHLIFNRHAA